MQENKYFVNVVYPGSYSTSAEKVIQGRDLALEFCELLRERCEIIQKSCYFPKKDEKLESAKFDEIEKSSEFTLVVFTEKLSQQNWEDSVVSMKQLYPESLIESLERYVKNGTETSPPYHIPILLETGEIPVFMVKIATVYLNKQGWRTDKTQWGKLLYEMEINLDQKSEAKWQKEFENVVTDNSENVTRNNEEQVDSFTPDGRKRRDSIAELDIESFCQERYNQKNGGIVLFLNYGFFKFPDWKREGSETDVKNYRSLFEDEWKNYYTFCAKEDLTKTETEIFLKISKLKEKFPLKKYSCAIVIVSSHGKLDGSESYAFQVPPDKRNSNDPDQFNVEKFIKFTTKNLRKSILDEGSPIVFFLSTCHGEDYLKRQKLMSADLLSQDGNKDKQNQLPAPKTADIFVGYAQSKGFAAFRNDKGTWYLRALLEAIKKSKEDLNTIHTAVQSILSQKDGHTWLNNKRKMEPTVQQPSYNSTLRKKLFLAPPPAEANDSVEPHHDA